MSTSFEDLKTLQIAEKIADAVWSEVQLWKEFEKRVLGEQFARAADSIGANIAEAYGRFHYGDKLKFLYYSRGSLFETKYWLNLATARNLIEKQRQREIADQLSHLAIQINAFARSLREQKSSMANKLGEETTIYNTSSDQTIFTEQDINLISTLESLFPFLGVL